MGKENRRLLLSTALALFAGMLLGIITQLPPTPSEGSEPHAEAASIGFACVLPDTVVETNLLFTRCNHIAIAPVDNGSIVGCTESELAARLYGQEVAVFTSRYVQLKRAVDGYCGSHVVLLPDEEGRLVLARMRQDTLEMETVKTLPVALDMLDESIREEITRGVAFETLRDADVYLENIES